MSFQLDTYHWNVTDSELIVDMQRVASELGKKTITRAEQDQRGKFHSATIYRRFGNWPAALKKAELGDPRVILDISDEELYRNLEGVWTKLGRQPRMEETHEPLSKYHGATYQRRFGGWRKALEAFVAYIDAKESPVSDDASSGDTSQSGRLAEGSKDGLVASPRGPRNPARRLIMQVLVRDKGICQMCKRVATADGPDYHIDHITPWIMDGPTVLSNLQLLCSKCNLLKGDLDLTKFTEG